MCVCVLICVSAQAKKRVIHLNKDTFPMYKNTLIKILIYAIYFYLSYLFIADKFKALATIWWEFNKTISMILSMHFIHEFYP